MKHKNKTNGPEVGSDHLVEKTVGATSAKPYETPTLISYGDVRDVTLGGTLGFGESGAGFSTFDNLPPP